MDQKEKLGACSCFDLEEFKGWIISNPKATKLAIRKHFKCCSHTILRAIEALKLIKVKGVWFGPVAVVDEEESAAQEEEEEESFEEESAAEDEESDAMSYLYHYVPSELWEETEVVKKEFTFEQKKFIVAHHYEGGGGWDNNTWKIFERKFKAGSITQLLRQASHTVVLMFESTGSVTGSASFYAQQKKVLKNDQHSSDKEDNGVESTIKPSQLRKRILNGESKEPPQNKGAPVKRVRNNTTSPKPCKVCKLYRYEDHVKMFHPELLSSFTQEPLPISSISPNHPAANEPRVSPQRGPNFPGEP